MVRAEALMRGIEVQIEGGVGIKVGASCDRWLGQAQRNGIGLVACGCVYTSRQSSGQAW